MYVPRYPSRKRRFSLASPPSITPTLGAEIHTQSNAAADPNSTEANATTGWVVGGTGTLTSDAASPYAGTYALKMVSGDGANDRAEYDFTGVVGTYYRVSLWAKRGAQGTNQLIQQWVGLNCFADFMTAAYANYLVAGRASATGCKIRVYACATGATDDVVLCDSVSVKSLTLSSLFGSLQTGAVNVSVAAGLTIPINLQGGVVLALDNASTPANFILVYYDRALGKVVIAQCIAGVYTNLAATTTTYVAGTTLKAIKAGATVSVTYNGVAVGSPVSVTDSAYTLCGLFATDSSVAFTNLVIE